MQIDNLFQFIVPLTFLAIWALTSLFNREAQPLPPRPGRPQPPTGPGLGPSSATIRSDSLSRDPTLRWSSSSSTSTTTERPAQRRPAGRPDEGILIIEEPRRSPAQTTTPPSSSPRSNAGVAPRRGNRSRPAQVLSPKRPGPSAPRPLTGAVGAPRSFPQQMNRPLELDPLSMPPSPLLGSESRDIAKTVAEPTREAVRPVVIGDDFSLLLNSPAKLREAIIVNEILQPPVVLRRRRSL